jgi:pseudouridine-5'-phosphate glycosidase
VLVTVPIPEAHALPRAQVEATVAQALADAQAAGVSGPKLTPWLLARMATLTGGESITANRALLLNNASVAAQIARALMAIAP